MAAVIDEFTKFKHRCDLHDLVNKSIEVVESCVCINTSLIITRVIY